VASNKNKVIGQNYTYAFTNPGTNRVMACTVKFNQLNKNKTESKKKITIKTILS
jgi:hypothetical protein